MDRVLGKQLWGLARAHLNKVAKAEGLVWIINLRCIHLHKNTHLEAGRDTSAGGHMGSCGKPEHEVRADTSQDQSIPPIDRHCSVK